MKKAALVSTVLVAALALSGAAYAHRAGYGMTGGHGHGMMTGTGTGSAVSVEKFTQFRKETAGLRDELAVKRVELNNEYVKTTPDPDRIATLEKNIIDLRTKIEKAADKAGLKSWGHQGFMGPGMGMGHGMMYGYGYGTQGCTW